MVPILAVSVVNDLDYVEKESMLVMSMSSETISSASVSLGLRSCDALL